MHLKPLIYALIYPKFTLIIQKCIFFKKYAKKMYLILIFITIKYFLSFIYTFFIHLFMEKL